MKCIFVSDLHGNKKRFQKLFEIVRKEEVEGVFIGGDILPNQFSIKGDIDDFFEDNFFSPIRKIKNEKDKNIHFFTILGNDDPRVFEKYLIDADKDKIIDYVNEKTVRFNSYFVTGYSFIPPTPFQLKDWEKYDVSYFLDVGSVSPEEGIRSIDVDIDEIRYSTISDDLKKIVKNAPPSKTIFLFHSPPYDSALDHAALAGKKVDYAPMDVHIGSIAIKKFIEKKQPLLTLHGHVHESASITGQWAVKTGRTYSFSAAHDGPELALVRFDTKNLEGATRNLI